MSCERNAPGRRRGATLAAAAALVLLAVLFACGRKAKPEPMRSGVGIPCISFHSR